MAPSFHSSAPESFSICHFNFTSDCYGQVLDCQKLPWEVVQATSGSEMVPERLLLCSSHFEKVREYKHNLARKHPQCDSHLHTGARRMKSKQLFKMLHVHVLHGVVMGNKSGFQGFPLICNTCRGRIAQINENAKRKAAPPDQRSHQKRRPPSPFYSTEVIPPTKISVLNDLFIELISKMKDLTEEEREQIQQSKIMSGHIMECIQAGLGLLSYTKRETFDHHRVKAVVNSHVKNREEDSDILITTKGRKGTSLSDCDSFSKGVSSAKVKESGPD